MRLIIGFSTMTVLCNLLLAIVAPPSNSVNERCSNVTSQRLGVTRFDECQVVFFGDSITNNWVEYFDSMFPAKPYIARGVGGETTSQMRLRFWQDVVALEPAVVVILAGTNDIAENTGPTAQRAIEHNLMSMVEMAKGNNIAVVLSSVLPVSDYFWNTGLQPGPKIVRLNTWMRDYAIEHDIVYLDYHSAMVGEHLGLASEFSDDGVHPNEAGYRIMAPLAEAAIAEALQNE